MIVDAILYNGEREIFDLRYNILKDYVDEFVVVEFGETFSHNKKESHPINLPKVSYHFFTQIKDLKPDTTPYFINESNQREMIKNCLMHLDDEDTVVMGDCDEIWERKAVSLSDMTKIKLRQYTYWLNNRSSEDFRLGPVVCKYGTLKSKSLNELRSKAVLSDDYLGWHFTNMGGQDNLKYKVQSYSDQHFNIPVVHNNIPLAFKHNLDYLGRDFKLWVDESELPEEIVNNRDKYKHLLK